MPKDTKGFKYRVWSIIVSAPFEYFIMMLIVFNTLLLMMKVRVFAFILCPKAYNIDIIQTCPEENNELGLMISMRLMILHCGT